VALTEGAFPILPGVTPDEILDLFVHLEAYAGAARAFDSYQVALAVFAEQERPS
jgi:alkylhydroperoxidase/carboxymuconolactone decarboxylase family protein YurZ